MDRARGRSMMSRDMSAWGSETEPMVGRGRGVASPMFTSTPKAPEFEDGAKALIVK
jgi:hypothetical protein